MRRLVGNTIITALLLMSSVPVSASESEVQTPCDQVSHVEADAERGEPKAQLKLAKLYLSGHCVSQNLDEGAKWLISAAKLGYGPAQGYLAATLYKEHRYEDAARMARDAAEQGDAVGQSLLAFLYQDGQGVIKDEAEAARWAKRSAEQGNGGGQVTLALMYYHGAGVPKDYIEADKWYILAASNGYDNLWFTVARKLIELCRMSKQQIAEAQRRADAWKPAPEVKPE